VTLATAPANPTAPPPTPRSIVLEGEHLLEVGFEQLASFPYTIVDAGTGATPAEIEAARKRDQVPATIRALDQKRVAITGFALPLQLENGRAKKLFLMRDVSTCCFGATPNTNDYVVVTMKEGAKTVADIPIVLVGTLRIGERYEGGYLVSLYELEDAKYLGPRK
jgi:hypothetical protein